MPGGQAQCRDEAEGLKGSRGGAEGRRSPSEPGLGGGRSRAGPAAPPPQVTRACPARPPSCKMAAAESSDSEEEDLVSYGCPLQPLQEGKGPPGASSAPPPSLCQCVLASAGERPGVRHWGRGILEDPRGPVRSGSVRFAAERPAALTPGSCAVCAQHRPASPFCCCRGAFLGSRDVLREARARLRARERGAGRPSRHRPGSRLRPGDPAPCAGCAGRSCAVPLSFPTPHRKNTINKNKSIIQV